MIDALAAFVRSSADRPQRGVLRQVFELVYLSELGIDPIWQVMAPTRELGPWTMHGDLAYPTVTTDRFLREGDVI